MLLLKARELAEMTCPLKLLQVIRPTKGGGQLNQKAIEPANRASGSTH